jgi:membrane-bound lytic murein transglycosylase D
MVERVFHQWGWVLALLLLIAVPAFSADDDDFPEYGSTRPNVQFWIRVFAEWSMGQVVVHDLDHPAVIYEVADLPGPIEERYSEKQLEFIEDLNERWQDRLQRVEKKVRKGKNLNDREKEWVLRITTNAGTDRILGAHERVRTQRGLRERFRRGVEISGRYENRIRAVFRDAGLPEDLAFLPHVESSYQAAARSSAGAVGVWQFTRGTGRLYMRIDSAIDERLDPIIAARGAADYLRDAYDKLGNWPIALTSYNHGVVGMSRAVRRLGADYERIFLEYDGRSFGFASKNFYSEFLAARAIARDPQRYFPEGFKLEPPLDYDHVRLDRRATTSGIAGAYGIAVKDLATINPAWTRAALASGLPLPAGSTVWLPAGTLARHGGAVEIPASGLYVVRRGDNLSAIAAAHGVTVAQLREWNDIPRGKSLIHPGQELQVGGGAASGTHVVRRGDTLSAIATRYGMSVNGLRRLNGMRPDDSLIRVGQRLLVSGAAVMTVYVVRPGDTLLGIAARHGVRLSALLNLNRIHESATIYPGQHIRIPIRY